MAVAIGVGYFWRRGIFDDWRSDYVTGIGERTTVALEKGSEVVLNTGTAIAVALSPEHRTIRLFRGEIFLTITPEPRRPLMVRTPAGVIHVMGTAFNVRTTRHRTIASVVQGSIEVRLADHAAKPLAVHVSGGQEVVFRGDEIDQIQPCDATAVTAWQRGQMVFYHTPLGQVIADVNRYHPGRIIILSPRLRDLPVSGVFHTTSPEAVLTTVERTLRVQTVRLSNRLVLLY
jgi:transmembrane sensor